MNYYVRAELPNEFDLAFFDEDSDNAATFKAIEIIMDSASAKPTGVWATGAITLVNVETNEVLRTMEAKV
jgi:fumarate hydratase class II